MNTFQSESLRIAVDEIEAARAIGMSVYFLRKDRRTRRMIPFYKIGDCVRYDLVRVREALLAMEEGGHGSAGGVRVAKRGPAAMRPSSSRGKQQRTNRP